MQLALILSAYSLSLLLSITAFAEENRTHGHSRDDPHELLMEYGMPGDAHDVRRKIEVEMNDGFAFRPATLRVKAGETVRLIVHNKGALMHEWILGTAKEIQEHAELMRRFPNMEHEEPQQVRVPPGQTRELVWQFNRTGTFTFACLQPGHFESGMKGIVEVR